MSDLPMLLPMTGSMRQRGRSSWELRVYQGVDPASGRQRSATRTVRGSAHQARLDLAEFVNEIERSRIHAGTVADLLVAARALVNGQPAHQQGGSGAGRSRPAGQPLSRSWRPMPASEGGSAMETLLSDKATARVSVGPGEHHKTDLTMGPSTRRRWANQVRRALRVRHRVPHRGRVRRLRLIEQGGGPRAPRDGARTRLSSAASLLPTGPPFVACRGRAGCPASECWLCSTGWPP